MLMPEPPIEMVVDKTVELYITIALGAIAAGALVYALWQWAKTGRPLAVLLFISGGLMMIFEPMVDVVGGCWFPANSWTAYQGYGRPMPVWLCLSYFFYFGICSALMWIQLKRGLSRKALWLVFVGTMIGDLLFESALLTVKPYTYYGNQPLMLGNGFAMWWMPVNGLIPVVLGAVVYRFDGYFRGWKALSIVPIALSVSASVNASVGWPSWMAVNTAMPWLATQLCGLATFAVAFGVMQLVCHFVASDGRVESVAEAYRPRTPRAA